MPTYQYACKQCGEGLEVQQSFTDDALTECPSCGGVLRKVYNAVGVVFKGSGFYRNDSRDSSSSKSSSSTSDTSSKESSDSSSSGSSEGSSTKSSSSSDSSSSKPAEKSSTPTSAAS